MAEWGERQPDGSVVVRNDEGRPERQESWAQNQGQAGGGGGGGGTVGGNVGANPATFQPAINLADNAAQLAYNNARLALDREQGIMRDEREKERIALEAARDAWNKTYQTASLTGYVPGTGAAGKGQAVMDAMAQLRTNAQYATADGATRRQMEAAAVAQATGIDTASAAQAIERLRALTATTGQPSSAALVEQVLGQTPGGAGAATLDREREQNRASMDALTLLSNLRGPENAFAYANTLGNLPASIRANIQASMGRMPFAAQNPAQRGVLGDVGALGAGSQAFGQPAMLGPGQFALQAGGRTLEAGRSPMAYLPAPPAAPPAGQPGQLAQQPYAQPMPQPSGYSSSGDWSDASRGNPQPGMVYAQVITPNDQNLPVAGGPRTPAASGEPFNPGQLSPTDMLRTDPYAQKLMWGGFSNAGGDIESGKWRYAQSLPRAYGPRVGRLGVA